MHLRFISILACCLGLGQVYSQELTEKPDSASVEVENKNIFKKFVKYFEDSNKENPDKPFDISFIGGPYYSNDTKLGIGLVASGLYRVDRTDMSLPPSDVSLYSSFSTSGMFAIGIMGNTIFKNDAYRINFDMFFASMPSRYWGIGYRAGSHKDDYSKYTENRVEVKADFLKKVLKNTYVGLTVTAQNLRAIEIQHDEYFTGLDKTSRAIGGGVIASYDSRDFIPNPSKGMFFKIEQNFYPGALGSTSSFNCTELTARYYKTVWQGGIIAFDLMGTFNNGHVPWQMNAKVGGSRRMRGYYLGQYQDSKLVTAQVELRQKVYHRSGVVVWAGAGNTFPEFDSFKWSQTLPTFGVGYRWEFKNRVNVRLDYGIGKGQSAFYFNINEAF